MPLRPRGRCFRLLPSWLTSEPRRPPASAARGTEGRPDPVSGWCHTRGLPERVVLRILLGFLPVGLGGGGMSFERLTQGLRFFINWFCNLSKFRLFLDAHATGRK